MSLCPDAAWRDSLPDGAFWEWALLGIRPGDPPPDLELDLEELERSSGDLGVCLVCGELGPCGYDAEGRPMIHTTDEDEVDP